MSFVFVQNRVPHRSTSERFEWEGSKSWCIVSRLLYRSRSPWNGGDERTASRNYWLSTKVDSLIVEMDMSMLYIRFVILQQNVLVLVKTIQRECVKETIAYRTRWNRARDVKGVVKLAWALHLCNKSDRITGERFRALLDVIIASVT